MTNLPTSQFSFPTQVKFGHGETGKIEAFLESMGAKNPLLVTDGGMLKTGAFERVKEALDSSGSPWGLFGEVLPNPTEANVDQGSAQYVEGGHDSLIGFGGGSAIDAAKGIAVRVALDGPLEGYSPAKISGALPPIVAIPTTSGTGSEVGRATVIVLASTGHKAILFDPRLLPKIAILDPDLVLDLPAGLTAATGMDAFTHCLESYICPVFHPVCDAIALGGLEMTIEFLPRAVRDGKDAEARGQMMVAAMMGALAFQKDLGSAHAMAHPLSTLSGLHHGLANAIVLPYVMAFNRPVVETAFARIATLFDKSLYSLPAAEASREAVRKVYMFNETIGLPTDLKAAGVSEEDLEPLAVAASQDGCRLTNPRETTLSDFRDLFRAAYAGTLVLED
jgi:alcohol dehydrogenase class IV